MSNRLNILYLGFYKFPAGSAGAKRVQYQAEFLKKSKNSVCIILPKSGNSGVFNNIPYYYGAFSAFYKIIKSKKKNCKNIIISGTLIGPKEILYIILGKILGYKLVLDKVENHKYFEEELTWKNKINIKTGLFFENFLKLLVDGLMVISTFLYNDYKQISKPLLLMPNSIPLNCIMQNKKQKFNNPIKLIYAGTFGKKDGVEYLIRAFKKLKERYNNVELHLVGKGTKFNLNRIKKEINDNFESIIQHGFVEEKIFQKVILEGDILIVTRTNSKYANYGFPYKITEYLCTGNPIIATKVGDVEKYFKHRRNIIFAKAESVTSLVDALEFCIKNEERTIKIGKNAQKIIESAFSIEKNGKHLLNFLLNL